MSDNVAPKHCDLGPKQSRIQSQARSQYLLKLDAAKHDDLKAAAKKLGITFKDLLLQGAEIRKVTTLERVSTALGAMADFHSKMNLINEPARKAIDALMQVPK